jgi:hypothetical protein
MKKIPRIPMKTKLFFTLLVFSATSALAQQNDWRIVPRKRLGPITPETSRTDLDRLFGKANVQDQPVDSGEGRSQPQWYFPRFPMQYSQSFGRMTTGWTG